MGVLDIDGYDKQEKNQKEEQHTTGGNSSSNNQGDTGKKEVDSSDPTWPTARDWGRPVYRLAGEVKQGLGAARPFGGLQPRFDRQIDPVTVRKTGLRSKRGNFERTQYIPMDRDSMQRPQHKQQIYEVTSDYLHVSTILFLSRELVYGRHRAIPPWTSTYRCPTCIQKQPVQFTGNASLVPGGRSYICSIKVLQQ